MRNLILLVTLWGCLLSSAQAKFVIEYSNNFTSAEDDVSNFSFSKMDNRVFLGAALDKKEKFFFGQNFMLYNRDVKADSSSSEDTLSIQELGPRFAYYFGEKGGAYFTLAWNPYAKGERQVGGATEDISGSSYFIAFGYLLRATKTLYLGASINYHVLSISESTDTNNVESEVTQTYTSIYPTLEFSFRF